MTLTEARKILGLGADEDPRPHLEEFKKVREQIADMVRTAPNDMLAERYQQGLVEFDRALAAVREYLEALGLAPREEVVEMAAEPSAQRGQAVFVSENQVEEPVGLPLESQELPEEEPVVEPEPTVGKGFMLVCWLLLLLAVAGFGGWTYLKIKEERDLSNQARVAFLERQGSIFIEGRRWAEAGEAFDEIAGIYPDSELVTLGRRGIEAGMIEEQNQFIGYWKGEAISAFEASRWEDAEKAANEVLTKYPGEEELVELVGKISEAKSQEKRQAAFSEVREQMEERNFDEAISGATALLKSDESDKDAIELLKDAKAAKLKAEEDLVIALGLQTKTIAADTGEYNEEALEWMREAISLAPDNAEILATYERIAAYTRTIRIPDDVATLEEALATSRDKDRLVLGAGTWEGPLIINNVVKLEGIPGKTIIQCEAGKSSVISFGPNAHGATVAGITMRHLSFDDGEQRFSVALLRGAKVDFSDCRFEKGSGHGLAIQEGGHAKVLRCRFTENGWNGISVRGSGSLLEAENNILSENYQNGIESWDGASVILRENTCSMNTRNGIHLDNGLSSATVLDNVLSENHEFGMILTSAGSGEITGNVIEKNTLGGIVGMAKVTGVKVTANNITKNLGPGLVLEKAAIQENYIGNKIFGNSGEELIADVDFAGEQ
ncbi:right-handed parallel beta-helix repeat-containing protein [Luteolibacter sp. AS25]|uniref:right-handed parallel beta-helix repeat-containing protein n=1 Tax=Luteolibacter sp. AS25 TaxID=3135776 RepID=UPI00398A5120